MEIKIQGRLSRDFTWEFFDVINELDFINLFYGSQGDLRRVQFSLVQRNGCEAGP